MNYLSALCLLVLSTISLSSAAHSPLQSSSPAHQAVLHEAPEALALAFSGQVRLLKLSLTDHNNNPVAIDFTPSPQRQKNYHTALPPLPAGTYSAQWIALSADTHKLKGTIMFTVNTTPNASQPNTAQP